MVTTAFSDSTPGGSAGSPKTGDLSSFVLAASTSDTLWIDTITVGTSNNDGSGVAEYSKVEFLWWE